VNDDNDRLIATYPYPFTTTQPNRKRPAADPKVDRGASDPIGIINLCDGGNKEEGEEEEEETSDSLINIDDDT
jgi:hypothetical protein